MPHGSFWHDEKVIFVTYIVTHQKSLCLSEIHVSVGNICSNKLWRNAEERFRLEILSWGQRSGNKSRSPFNDYSYVTEFISWACYHLPMQVMKQKNPLEKFITNAEAYLKPLQISTMELFGLTVFAKKLHLRFSIGF